MQTLPRPDLHKICIQENAYFLTQNLIVDGVFESYLFSNKAITLEEWEMLSSSNKTKTQKACFVCQLLLRKDCETFDIFLEALKACDHEHVTYQLKTSLNEIRSRAHDGITPVTAPEPEPASPSSTKDVILEGTVVEEFNQEGKLKKRVRKASFRSNNEQLNQLFMNMLYIIIFVLFVIFLVLLGLLWTKLPPHAS